MAEDRSNILDENTIYKSRVVVNKKIDDYEKVLKSLTSHFNSILCIEKAYKLSYQQLIPEPKDSDLRGSNSPNQDIFELCKESEYEKDMQQNFIAFQNEMLKYNVFISSNIKECAAKLKKDLMEKVDILSENLGFLENNIIKELEKVLDSMTDMRNSFNRIIDEDISSSRIDFIQHYEQQKMPLSQLQKWSDEANQSLQCLVNNSRNQSRVIGAQGVELACKYIKVKISERKRKQLKGEQDVRRVQMATSKQYSYQGQKAEDIFHYSMFDDNKISLCIKERHSNQLKKMLQQSRNFNKIEENKSSFTKENIEGPDERSCTSQDQDICETVKQIEYDLTTEVTDLLNPFKENLKQKFSKQSFEELLVCIIFYAVGEDENYDKEDKISIQNLFCEVFQISDESRKLLKNIISTEQSQSEKQNDSVISTTLKSLMNLIYMGNQKENTDKASDNILSILFDKIVRFSERDSIFQSNDEHLRDLLQQLLIVIALNNQWHSKSTFEEDSSELQQCESSFENFAKLFFCEDITLQHILWFLKEQPSLPIYRISFPLSFQATLVIIKKFILPFIPDQDSGNQMLHEHWIDGFELISKICQKYFNLSSQTVQLIFLHSCYTDYIRNMKTIKISEFVYCFSELTLQYNCSSNKENEQHAEKVIQKKIALEIVQDMFEVFSHIYKYVLYSGLERLPTFCQALSFLLNYATDNDEGEKRTIVEKQFSSAGKNLSFELMKQGSQSFQPEQQRINNTENQNEDKQFLFESCDAGKLNEGAKQPEQVPFSIKKQRARSVSPKERKYSEIKETGKNDEILRKISKIISYINSNKDFDVLLSIYFPQLQKLLNYPGNELMVIFFNNLLADVFEQLKILSQGKIMLSPLSNETILTICTELQRFDSVIGYPQNVCYFENAVPLLNHWIENFKRNKASTFQSILLDEKWEPVDANNNKGNQELVYCSKNCLEFVSIVLKTVEYLVSLSHERSLGFSKRINSLIETILIECCEFYCEVNLCSLDGLKDNLIETQLTLIGKFSDEIHYEESFEQESNLSILRSLLLRQGNIRFLSDSLSSHPNVKSLDILELLNDKLNFTSKKISEIIGRSCVSICLKNFFDCYLHYLQSNQLSTMSLFQLQRETQCSSFMLMPRYKAYFILLEKYTPKNDFQHTAQILADQFEKSLIASFTDINKLEHIQNHKKLGLFIQLEIDYIVSFLKRFFSQDLHFSDVYKIAILYQKESADLIMQIENLKISDLDRILPFRIVYMRRKLEQVCRSYAEENKHKFIKKKILNLENFLLNN